MYKLGAIYSRATLRCGGVCIHIHEEITYSNINLQCYCKEQDLEIVAIKFNFNKSSFLIYCVYRAPSGNLEYFYEQLDSILNAHQNLKSDIILCGDLNIDYILSNHKKKQLDEFLHTYNLKGIIHLTTRITPSTTSLIDNIFIGKNINYSIIPIINGLSDHDAPTLNTT
jgi:exonuclease III